MNDYNWREHWQGKRRDGTEIVDVRESYRDELSVVSWSGGIHCPYRVKKNGSHADYPVMNLLPIVREPVLVPWTQETFPLGSWLRRKGGSVILPHGDVASHGVEVDRLSRLWRDLLAGWQHTIDSVAPRVWLPCGVLETPT